MILLVNEIPRPSGRGIFSFGIIFTRFVFLCMFSPFPTLY